MTQPIAAALIALLFCVSMLTYLLRYRNTDNEVYSPMAAWNRAINYFCLAYLMGWYFGVWDMVLNNPVATAEHMELDQWWYWVVGVFAWILFSYWGVWARFTIRFDRKLDLLPQIVFGILWGTASGQVFLAWWNIATAVGGGEWATWQVYAFVYAALTFWQWFLMDMFWDIYISPEHDTLFSIGLKVAVTHVPNITITLWFFALYENALIFIALQTLALTGACIMMRMPAPWSKEQHLLARKIPSVFFGLPRCGGYVSPDPENDAYLRAAHLPR
ncbi:hypothetical protein [Oceanicoccus sagamiensis]|uniref:Uncharacterized protein n=1 Tax=Oceanicoccus sagamiensis TaxID=716816 RepID=A0A1X9NDU5_9GAMM|nr:hypothetical protein [Oceanicoccus sagamiensis]ARN74592.1 hypothetical protein BST96_10945 [Oceanicoccus sagamiensis]